MNYLRPAIIALLAGLALLPAGAAPAHANGMGQIAFTSDRDGNNEIYVMNADGSGQTNFTNNPAGDFGPNWSPDGSRIAFTSDRDGNSEIYVMNADGSDPTNLTNHAAPDSDPNWSPDGNLIAFVTGRDGDGEIYLMNADGSGQTNVSNNPETSNDLNRVSGLDVSPTWSPDGSRIAFWSSAQTSAGVVGENIYVVNADGSGRASLTGVVTSDIRVGQPAWAPDSNRIAYHTGFTLSQGYADFASRTIGATDVDRVYAVIGCPHM